MVHPGMSNIMVTKREIGYHFLVNTEPREVMV